VIFQKGKTKNNIIKGIEQPINKNESSDLTLRKETARSQIHPENLKLSCLNFRVKSVAVPHCHHSLKKWQWQWQWIIQIANISQAWHIKELH